MVVKHYCISFCAKNCRLIIYFKTMLQTVFWKSYIVCDGFCVFSPVASFCHTDKTGHCLLPWNRTGLQWQGC